MHDGIRFGSLTVTGNVIESVQDEFILLKKSFQALSIVLTTWLNELGLGLDRNVGFPSLFLSEVGNNLLKPKPDHISCAVGVSFQ